MPRPPQEFEGFIGQSTKVKLLRRYIDGAHRNDGVLVNMLLTGDPGLGKTMLARAAARQMKTNFHATTAAREMEASKVYETLATLAHGDIWFIDECHNLPADVQDLLLGAAGEDRRVQKIDGGRISIDETTSVAAFTLALATDQPGRLNKALRSRIHLRLDLTPYTDREMRAIVERLAEKHGVELSSHAVGVLACASRGNPREAVKLVTLAARYAPDRNFTKPVVDDFLAQHGIDPESMFHEMERRYLALLGRAQRPVSLKFAAASLGTDIHDVERDVEAFLIRQGLITTSSKGRELTPEGQQLAERFAAAAANDADAKDVTLQDSTETDDAN